LLVESCPNMVLAGLADTLSQGSEIQWGAEDKANPVTVGETWTTECESGFCDGRWIGSEDVSLGPCVQCGQRMCKACILEGFGNCAVCSRPVCPECCHTLGVDELESWSCHVCVNGTQEQE
jgi:hypothetical protein